MGSPGSIRPWRKSRTFGDIYGGRVRNRVTDQIFERTHSIDLPGPHDELPLVIADNASKHMVFPAPANKIVARVRSLPEQDTIGITHLWLRRAKPNERGTFAEFVCGSGVRMIVIYPWPSDLTLRFGRSRPPARKLREFAPWTEDLRSGHDGWSGPQSRSKVGAWTICSSMRSATISIGTAATGRRQTVDRLRPLLIPTPHVGRLWACTPSSPEQTRRDDFNG